MAGELIDFGNRVSKITDPAALNRITLAGGLAAKTASMAAAASDLGGDRAFSGLGRKISLGVGFDQLGGTMIQVNFRPAGLWKLAESGRRGGKVIRPRKRGKRALLMPDGEMRAASVTGAWGGKGTFTSAVRASRVVVPRAAFRAFQIEVARVVR